MFEIKRRKLHPEQRSTNVDLLATQQRMLWERWSNDFEIYDNGELTAITSRLNPNLGELLTQLTSTGVEPSDPRDILGIDRLCPWLKLLE